MNNNRTSRVVAYVTPQSERWLKMQVASTSSVIDGLVMVGRSRALTMKLGELVDKYGADASLKSVIDAERALRG